MNTFSQNPKKIGFKNVRGAWKVSLSGLKQQMSFEIKPCNHYEH